jgi:membrane protein YdbS with pleckstrin-like domain
MTAAGNINSVMTTKDWFLTIVITLIFPIGFIMLLVWVFKADINQNKVNYAKAVLMLYGLLFTIYIAYMIIFGVAILSSMGNI